MAGSLTRSHNVQTWVRSQCLVSLHLLRCRFKMPLRSCLEIIETKKKSQTEQRFATWLCYGWQMGLEPATLGTTIRCSNQLSYSHHIRPEDYPSNRLQRYEFFFTQQNIFDEFFKLFYKAPSNTNVSPRYGLISMFFEVLVALHKLTWSPKRVPFLAWTIGKFSPRQARRMCRLYD